MVEGNDQLAATLKGNLKDTLEKSLEDTYPETLKKAMLYSVQAGGKRLRPNLILDVVAGFHGPLSVGVYQVASAVEMVHTYSLIHDDLPAMDNDDYRRGKLTNHKVFGEAVAILAGDGLLTEAFALLAASENPADQVVALTKLLGKKAGTNGMVSGQVLDINATGQQLNLEQLTEIHRLKTGALIEFCLMTGGILTNQSQKVIKQLEEVGTHFGLAFQIKDDLLDVEGDFETLGKAPHQDEILNKSTFPKLLGLDGAKEALAKEIKSAQEILANIQQTEDFDTTAILAKLNQLK
ncbi:polyprenyl synthetase family protein [Enterococcus timonensis]|uniref:polyprenyl synthetase family protein n=1 Tax=Enterococcus timonensis TaxID=1852364 RepID=UPI0008DA097F|nr:farnesyl diphosphate synthase [Enterococcus timonensis]